MPYPSWEELKAEDREEAPAAFLTIRDSDGQIVRTHARRTGTGHASRDMGFPLHRFHAPAAQADGDGPLAVPGTYTVSLSTRVDGKGDRTGRSHRV